MKFKLFTLIALSVLTIFSFAVLSSATVEENDYSDVNLKIVSKNLSYKDSIHLLIACNTDGAPSDKVELLMWKHEPASVTDTPYFTDTDATPYYDENGDVIFDTVFESFGISAKDMSDAIYMAAHIKGTDVYSNVYRYSPLEYLYERISIGNPSDEQLAFYESVIDYAENAQIVLKHEVDSSPNDLNYVAVRGGKISDGYTAGTYYSGSEITISANSPDTFSMWTNAKGEVVSYEPTFTTYANDKASLFMSVSGYNVTVNVGDSSTTTPYAPGDIATLSAPAYMDEDGVRKFFVGWIDGNGSTVSTVATAKVEINESETYTASYLPISEISGATLIDYSTTDQLPIISYSKDDTSEIESAYTKIYRRSKLDGYAMLADTARDTEAPKEYINTFFDASASAHSARFSLDILISARDINGSETNDRGDYTTNALSDTVYTLIYTSGSVTRSIKLEIACDGDLAVGFNLVDEGGSVLATIGFDTAYNITLELSTNGDNTLSTVYLDGVAISTDELECEYVGGDGASVSICIDTHTQGRLYADNNAFYSFD